MELGLCMQDVTPNAEPQLDAPNASLRNWGAFLLPCPCVSCVIKDMDRLEKQSLVVFSVYKALAVTCYADKEWESLIS